MIDADPAYPTEVSQVTYPLPSKSVSSCNLLTKCLEVQIIELTYARDIHFKLGFQPDEKGTAVYIPFKIQVFEPPAAIIYDKTPTLNSYMAQHLIDF